LADAVRYAERLLREEPLREQTCRALIRLHDARGDRARAVSVYHECAATLERELGVEPSAKTRATYDALLARDEQPAGTRLGGPPFVGRTAERARLAAAWLRASEIPSVILRSSYHMTNVLFFAESIRSTGKIFAPVDGAKIAMVDRRDLAAVAALTEDGHDGRTYLISGPEAITYHDVASHLSQVLGKTVEFVDVPDEAATAAALQAGAPEWMALGIGEVHRQLKRGIAAQTTDVVRMLLEREPYSFADFARTLPRSCADARFTPPDAARSRALETDRRAR